MAAPTPTLQDLQNAISKLNLLTGQNYDNLLNGVANDAQKISQNLKLVNDQIQQIAGDTNYLDQSFEKIVKTMQSMLPILALHRSAIKPLENQAENLLRIKRGEQDFNYKNYLIFKDQNKQSIDRLNEEIKRTQIQKNQGLISDQQADNRKKELEDQIQDAKYINGEYEEALILNNKINKELGIRAITVKALDSLIKDMGLPDLGFEDAWKETQRLAQEAESAGEEFNAIKTFTSIISTNLTASLNPIGLLQNAAQKLYEATKAADKSTSELAKSFGVSYAEAASLRNELNTIANLSTDINVNTASLQKALIELNKQFGTSTMLNGELLKDYTRLTEVAGYTAEAAASLSKITVATGTDLSKNTSEILGQAVAFNAVNGLALNEKEIVEAVAKTSAATTLSLGMQSGKIAEANLQAKALGTTLEKVEQIASSLLQFESSIEAELSAELLVGKDLYLERARLLALNNDLAGVAEEIAKQIGTAADFTNMNVIQQEALAKAVGMTREDLAKSLIEREALAKIGEGDKTALEAYNRLKKEGLSDDQIALKLGDDKLAAQLRSQSIQERFNKSVEKLQEIFVSLAEPILQIVSPFMDLATTILPLINIVLTPIFETIKAIGEGFQFVISLITGEGGFKEGLDGVYQVLSSIAAVWLGIVGIQKLLKTQLLMNLGIQTATTSGLITQFVLTMKIAAAKIAGFYAGLGPFGIPLAIATIAGLYAAVRSATSKRADDMISPGYGKRTLLAPEGAIALNDKDTVIAGTKLSRDNNSSSNNQNTSINFEPMVSLLSEIKGVLGDINKQSTTTVLEVDGQKLATAQNIRTFKIQ